MSSPDASAAARWRTWLRLVLLLVPALGFWMWAVRDVEHVVPWAWRGGWMLPVPSLTFTFLAAGVLVALLSGMAWLLHTTPAGARVLPGALSVTIVAIFAVDVRIGQAILSPVPISAGALALDLLAVAALLAALWRAGRSAWWGLLYAIHPLVLLAGPGSWRLSAAVLVALLLVEGERLLARRDAKWKTGNLAGMAGVFTGLGMLVVTAGSWWIDRAAPEAAHSQGFITVLTSAFTWGRAAPEAATAATAIIAPMALVAVILVGTLQRWKMPAALIHAALVYALVAPRYSLPAAALPLAVAMLSWNRGAWVFAAGALAFAAGKAFQEPFLPAGLPDWVSLFVWIPLLVTEGDELFRRVFRGRVVISTQPTLSVSSPP